MLYSSTGGLTISLSIRAVEYLEVNPLLVFVSVMAYNHALLQKLSLFYINFFSALIWCNNRVFVCISKLEVPRTSRYILRAHGSFIIINEYLQ